VAVRHGGNIFSEAARAGLPWQHVLDFSASINPLGPSPAAREAMLAAVDRVAHYPEPAAERLRTRLAEEWGVRSEDVLIGHGATDLLFDWCRWAGTGTIASPAFGEFHRVWPGAAVCKLGDPESWPANGPLVFTRPANPTGELADAAAIRGFVRARQAPVLVDESFLDFCAAESLIASAPANLFVLRSLTKFWALPGLRVGALIGAVEEIARHRAPWPLNTFAEAAALASLDDSKHFERTREFVREEGDWLAAELSSLPGITVAPRTANFLYCLTPRATALAAFARTRQVLLRDCSEWPGLPAQALRIAVRPRWENEILIRLCKEFLCA